MARKIGQMTEQDFQKANQPVKSGLYDSSIFDMLSQWIK
jgi:hypothetical protein